MVHDLTKNESSIAHMVWSPAVFLPHFLPVPPYSLFACHIPSYFLNTPSTFLLKTLVCGILSVWGTLSVGYVASFLSPLGHIPRKTISDPSQTILAHQPITFYSLILLYFPPYYYYTRHDIFIYLIFIHLFPLTYHSMRAEILFPLLYTEHLEQFLNHTRYSIYIK